MWAHKYAPSHVSDVIGQGRAVEAFAAWHGAWKPGSPAALLHGGTGTGKTALVHALARERSLDIVEINASDTRNADAVHALLGSASKQQSLFRRGKIILVDEVDGLAGREDRGGVGAVLTMLKESKFPVVLTANDAYDPKLRTLRAYVTLVPFGKVHMNSIVARLRQICVAEGVECEDATLKQVARTSGGDMRAALTDLETLARSRRKIEHADAAVLGYREQEQSVFDALRIIFKTQTLRNAVDAIERTDKDAEEIFWWLETNITNEYDDPHEVATAFDALSRSDVLRSRVRKRQNWRFARYATAVMCGGVALAKRAPYAKFTRYAPPQRLLAYGRTKARRNAMAAVCEKLTPHVHASARKIMRDYTGLFGVMLNKEAAFAQTLASAGLTEDEIEMFQ
ncbi:MAG: replication factor C large subunit [Candidatus Aenigmarchaeota archaeon]|nr:replication factor C large subunit [Candidatus Aenigmarchaeota archaeon]